MYYFLISEKSGKDISLSVSRGYLTREEMVMEVYQIRWRREALPSHRKTDYIKFYYMDTLKETEHLYEHLNEVERPSHEKIVAWEKVH